MVPHAAVLAEIRLGGVVVFPVFERASVDPKTGCWCFYGHRNEGGYGVIRWRGKPRKAHRVAWEITRGPIPAGMSVLHKCDRRECVNPGHLFLGTQTENMQDCAAKGRTRTGRVRKLGDEDAVSIRARPAASERSLAAEFGVSRTAIRRIREGKTYRVA